MLYWHGEDRDVLMLPRFECAYRRACKLLTDYNQRILIFHSVYDYSALLKTFNTNTFNFHKYFKEILKYIYVLYIKTFLSF